MELALRRTTRLEDRTLGELSVDGKFECYTLEDEDRLHKGGLKVDGLTAIPIGRYKIRLALSPKRGYMVPWVDGVPGFSHVQIHRGNGPEDSHGCVLVGTSLDQGRLVGSRVAFEALVSKLRKAEEERWEDIWLTIS